MKVAEPEGRHDEGDSQALDVPVVLAGGLRGVPGEDRLGRPRGTVARVSPRRCDRRRQRSGWRFKNPDAFASRMNGKWAENIDPSPRVGLCHKELVLGQSLTQRKRLSDPIRSKFISTPRPCRPGTKTS